jgi:hypothetical protein
VTRDVCELCAVGVRTEKLNGHSDADATPLPLLVDATFAKLSETRRVRGLLSENRISQRETRGNQVVGPVQSAVVSLALPRSAANASSPLRVAH